MDRDICTWMIVREAMGVTERKTAAGGADVRGLAYEGGRHEREREMQLLGVRRRTVTCASRARSCDRGRRNRREGQEGIGGKGKVKKGSRRA